MSMLEWPGKSSRPFFVATTQARIHGLQENVITLQKQCLTSGLQYVYLVVTVSSERSQEIIGNAVRAFGFNAAAAPATVNGLSNLLALSQASCHCEISWEGGWRRQSVSQETCRRKFIPMSRAGMPGTGDVMIASSASQRLIPSAMSRFRIVSAPFLSDWRSKHVQAASPPWRPLRFRGLIGNDIQF